jgi:hypothetical protein
MTEWKFSWAEEKEVSSGDAEARREKQKEKRTIGTNRIFPKMMKGPAISPLTLSPWRVEGDSMGSRSYLGVVRHGYDGLQTTARPTKLGSRAAGFMT